MPKKSLRKKLGRVTVFSKVGLAMAGSILLQSAPASAGNPDFPGGRGAAFRDFKQANDGLSGKQLNQLFKVHWADMTNSAQAVAQPVFEQNANNLSHGPNVVNTNLNNLQNLSNLPNQVGATKQELNQQFKLERQAQKLEHQALKQELREAKQNFNTVQQISADRFIRGNGGFSLDLSSAVENITLGDKLFQSESSITISIGGESKTLSAGSKVTAAEYIAAKQVLATGGQKVGLDANGRAVSGSIDLNELTPGDKTMKVRDFVVPENVSAAGDFSKNGDIRITGDLINSGTIQAFSSDNKITTATISADNITNNSNASISSELNQSARDLGGVVSNLGLNLRADDVLSNYGSITSSGDLTLSAGKTLTNSGNAIAQNNLTLQAPKVVNSGRVESIAANVNLDSSSLSALTVNNYGGTISALDGAINIRSSEYQDRFDTLVSGGDLLSKELNVYTGGGTSNVFVNDLTGKVNTSGSAAHISANTDELVIGEQCLVGDPTFYNTGYIRIAGNITVGEDLAIIAGRDIFTTESSLNIVARSSNGQGCNITIIAGVNVQPGSGEITPGEVYPGSLPGQSGTPTHNATGSVSFTGQSVTGGSVELGGNLSIRSDSLATDSDGGNILIAAFGGHVWTSLTADINASGSGTGNNGNITVYAKDQITLGNPYSYLGTGTNTQKNTVTVIVSQPKAIGTVTFNTAGRMTSGSITYDTNLTAGGKVEMCSIRTRGDVIVKADGDIIMPEWFAPGTKNISVVSNNGDITFYGAIGDRILASAGGDLYLNSDVHAPLGMIFMAGHDIRALGKLYGTGNGDTGSITLISGATYSPQVGVPNNVLASSSGGSVYLSNGVQLDNHSLGGNGNAGDINLVAYGGSIFGNSNVGITNYGSGTGRSGSVIVLAQGMTIGSINQGTTIDGRVIASNQNATLSSIVTNPNYVLSYGALSGFSLYPGTSAAPMTIGDITGSRTVNLYTAGELKVGRITTSTAPTADYIDIRVNSSQSFNIGSGGNNGTGAINANTGSVGDGVSIEVTNTGDGGINISAAPSTTITDGNGMSWQLNAGVGTLNISALGTLINADGVGINKAGGTIDLRYGTLITAASSISFSASATGTGAGGKIILHDNAGSDDIVLGTAAGQFAVSSSGAGSLIELVTDGAIIVQASNPLNARNISLQSGAGGVSIDSAFAGDSFTVNTLGATSFLRNVAAVGDIKITAPSLSLNSTSMSGANIVITSSAGSSLTLDGGISGSTLASTATDGKIRVTATDGDLILQGRTTFSTSALLTAGTEGSSIVASSGSVTTALQTSYLLTSNLTLNGSLVTLNDTWVYANGGTYANSDGDLTLTGNINLSGLNLAIIAKGDVNLTGATINLSDSNANGGNLTIIAGYDFSPDTNGSTFNAGTSFRTFIESSGGGSVLGDAIISTESGFGNGGNVTIVASERVSLQSINSTGSIKSGDVRIYARDGIQIAGGITTGGDENGGNVNLELCHVTFSLTPPTPFSILNGSPNALPIVGGSTYGNISYGSIDAGLANVTFSGALAAQNTISGSGTIAGRILTINAGQGTATLASTSFEQFRGLGSNATVTMNNNESIVIAAVTQLKSFTLNNGMHSVSRLEGIFQNLDITASNITCNDALVTNNATLRTNGGGGIFGNLLVNGILTLSSGGNIGSSDSLRFTTSARQVSFTSGGSAYLSLTNSNFVFLGSSSAANLMDVSSSNKIINLDQENTLLTSPHIHLSVLNGDLGSSSSPIKLTNGANPFVLTLSTGTGSTAYANYLGTDLLVLENNNSAGSLELSTTANLVRMQSLTYVGNINIRANHFINEYSVASTTGDINLSSLNGSGLTLSGLFGGSFTANNGTINVTATSGDLTLEGKTTFTTTANLFAQHIGQEVVLSSGSETIANAASFIYSGTLTGNGALTTIAPASNPTWTLCNYATFTNTTFYPIVLSGTLKFGDVAILSNGNIDLTGATIDLSGPTGGNLTIIAGYSFSPLVSGQGMDHGTTFSNFTPNGYGSVLGFCNIITSATSGNSGKVLVVANHGAINLGSITTSSTTGAGGSVTLIADNSLSVGAINTTGVSSSGDVLLAASTTQIPTGNGLEIRDGQIVTGLSGIVPSTKSDFGSINMSSINAGDATISLYGSRQLTQTDSAVLSARKLNVNLNSMDTFSSLKTDVQVLEVGGGARLSVTNAVDKDLWINPINSPGVLLTVKGSGTGKISGTDFTLSYLRLEASEISISGTVNAQSVQIVTDGPITNANTGVLNAQGLLLQSLSSSIGTADQRFVVGANVMSGAFLAADDVYIQSLRTSGFLISSSTSGGELNYLGSGNTSLDGHLKTTNGNIKLVTTTGTLALQNGSTINAGGLSAGNGNILLQVLDTSKAAKKTAKITLVGSQLNTTASGTDGVITLSVGAVTTPVLGKAPKKNVQIINEGGTIFWGKKAAGFSQTNVLHTKGANIVFNNAIGNKNIVITGSTIFADPPVPEGTPKTLINTPVNSSFAESSNSSVVLPVSSLSNRSDNFLGLQVGAELETGLLLANSNLPLITEVDSSMHAKEVRQLAFNSSYEADNSYIVGNASVSNDFIAGFCSDAEVGIAGDGSIQRIQHNENVKVADGSVLFAPLRDTQVETAKGKVLIAANSIALVSVSEAGLSVFDLDDQHKGSVIVAANGHNVVLSPGRHVLITPHHKAEFAQLNPIETIAHRALSSSVKNGHRAHLSEFSVLSAFDSVKPLKALAASSHPTARKISGRMMKTTAILMQLGGAREQYQHYYRPHMTAMQK